MLLYQHPWGILWTAGASWMDLSCAYTSYPLPLCILCLPSSSPSPSALPPSHKIATFWHISPSSADNAVATSRQNWDCSWKWLIWNRVKIGAVTLSKIRAICCNLSGSSRSAAACGEEMVFWSLKGGGSGLRWWKRRGCRRLWRTFTCCSYWPWEIPRLPTQFLSWKVRVLAYEKGHGNSLYTTCILFIIWKFKLPIPEEGLNC